MNQVSTIRTGEDVTPLRKRKRKRRRRCKRHPQEGPHSPTCRGRNTDTSQTQSSPAMVKVSPKLRPILDYLDIVGDVFTRAEVMGHLAEYIRRKSLYDPADPRKVYCENDILEKIFGCKEFSTSNVCELLLRNLEIIPAVLPNTQEADSSCSSNIPTSCNFPSRRRLTSASTTESCSCSESDQVSASDRPCSSQSLSQQVTIGVKRSHRTAFSGNNGLPSTSSQNIETKYTTEYSIYYRNICDNSTDIVTDTSDDLFFLYETEEERVVRQVPESDVVDSDVVVENNTAESDSTATQVIGDENFSVEYEPLTFSEEESLLRRHGVDNEPRGDSCSSEVDEGEDGGDELGNGDSSDSEIEEEDKWRCWSCDERNHPMTRRCRRCWSQRKDWPFLALERTFSDPGQIRQNRQLDKATAITRGPVESTTRRQWNLTSSQRKPSHQVASSSSAVVHEAISDSTASDSKESYGRMKCLICRKAPPTGCIVHGSTGHQVCCYACARRLKESNQACPVCRKQIGKVIKNFM